MPHRRLNLVTAALMAAGFLFAAAPAGALSDSDRPAIEAIIKDYLVKHPEVLRDALDSLEKYQASEESKKQSTTIAANQKVIFESPRGPVFGNPKGDVTLVEFFDYNCGYCKHALADVMKLVQEDPQLKVVLKEFPVLGPSSGRCRQGRGRRPDAGQGRKIHRLPSASARHARRSQQGARAGRRQGSGLRHARIQKDIESAEVRDTITESMGIAQALGINGTPTFVVADEMIVGAQGYDTLKNKIASVRKCGKATC